MFLTVSTTYQPATDLGFLLHKHPDRVHRFDTAAGPAHVFYPEATDARCTAALLLEVDPVGLVRGSSRSTGRRGQAGGGRDTAGAHYVDDRPYAASSLLAVAMAAVFSTAMAGRCRARPELVTTPLPLSIRLPSLPCRGGGADLVRRLFEPLGWQVEANPLPLDPNFPDWGDAPHHDVTLTGTALLADALTQAYVLLPVLDDAKHYHVGRDEIDKLVREGARWLPGHPEQRLIARRYLAHRSGLATAALTQLSVAEDLTAEGIPDGFEPGRLTSDATEPDPAANAEPDRTMETGLTTNPEPGLIQAAGQGPSTVPSTVPGAVPGAVQGADADPVNGDGTPELPLAEQRRRAIMAELRTAGARRVADVGCGAGRLVARLVADRAFTEIVAVDVSHRALELTARRLHVEQMSDRDRERVRLVVSSLLYRDDRLTGMDAIVLSEVVEHVDPPRLPVLADVLLGHARPGTLLITTPNREYNVRYDGLPPGVLRHRDHRFEWTRAEFTAWIGDLVAGYPYRARIGGIGADDPEVGQPTQLAVLELAAPERGANR
ncbi:3' terminal RNA ribose 2'-O-methyltransferase Hen1 [Parafrankia sp. EUN1f]|uniref:3' terminal RNA ribose 2'-O-methyltransferase Hen1 n=1 Tax=Parafrankia sp. EUN1f TaxID=102897 RepID=UPI0001C441C6|nr:3' terminal RNA ribose 2'-O-methyltransferase Hen1 [Parafrankia sp. EUN1f]EFC86704.1 Methyltransferase type 12 [Parafrankia sp. EUN1f]